MSRRVPNPKNRIGETIERQILEMTLKQPAWGHTRMANELAKEGLRVSPTGVRGVWVRHDLDTMAKRLKALEARVAQDGLILTESQLAALEKAKADKEAHGEFDSACPGYCGAQDTFYVGTLKGVGRIYQQTFVDTYAKVGFTKLYDAKTAITAADLLNDRVLPFYEDHGIPLCRVLTDRGSKYCGNPERHEYELYLAIEDIDHSRTKTKSPQTNGICERFHKTVLGRLHHAGSRDRALVRDCRRHEGAHDQQEGPPSLDRPHSSAPRQSRRRHTGGAPEAHRRSARRGHPQSHMRRLGYDHKRMTREPPALRFQAERSNALWHFDMSPSDLKQLKSPSWLVADRHGVPTLMLFMIPALPIRSTAASPARTWKPRSGSCSTPCRRSRTANRSRASRPPSMSTTGRWRNRRCSSG